MVGNPTIVRRQRGGLSLAKSPDLANYNQGVARGWESKSVEAQQAEASQKDATRRVKLTPEAASRRREHESLRLSRQRVLQQLESVRDERHRTLLLSALKDLDEKLKQLGQ